MIDFVHPVSFLLKVASSKESAVMSNLTKGNGNRIDSPFFSDFDLVFSLMMMT